MIALLAALQNELSGVAKSMTAVRRIPGKPWQITQGTFSGKDILLVRTGMGKACALQTTAHLLENYPLTALVSFGFAGALTASLQVGDVVLCRALTCASPGASGVVHTSDPRLVSLAEQALPTGSLNLSTGACLTVEVLTATSAGKHVQGKTSAAQVVEMESYWVAGLAAARRVPFLAVRAISDALRENLPPFDRFMNADGQWLVKDALGYFLLTPGDLFKLPGIYRRFQKAHSSLTAFLTAFIPAL